MKTAAFGRTGIDVARVGQGTWNLELDDERAAVEALEAGIEAGMTHVDTAELYGNGRMERLLRGVVARRRDELFLVSKVMPRNASYRGTIEACERSLSRLGTERLDVYLLHWPGSVPLEETVRAFEALEADGKIGAWGVSNFDVADLETAAAVVGAERIACNQVLYHLGERSIEHTVVPWCGARGIAVVAYSPFGSGRFPAPDSPGGQVLAKIAAAHEATPRQIALAFLMRRAGAFVIPKAAVAAHARENAGAAEPELEPDEMRAVDEAFPSQPRRGLATL